MLIFTDFRRLYSEAMETNNVEMYIAERGWQDWMDDDSDPTDTLTSIYSMANGGITSIVEASKLNKTDFCRTFAIPRSTFFNWQSGGNNFPYTLLWLSYAVLSLRLEARNNDTGKD